MLATVVDDDEQLVFLFQQARHLASEKFARIIDFEKRRPIRNQRIISRVTFVKSVFCKRFHTLENVIGVVLRNAVGSAAFQKQGLHLRHVVGFFLRHRFHQRLGLAAGKARQNLRRLHDLLLIQQHSIGVFENRFEFGMRIGDFAAVTTADIFRDFVHRAGTIQRNLRDDVLEIFRLHLAQQAAHSGSFHLKNRDAVAFAQHIVDFFVVQFDVFQVDLDAVPRLDQFQRVVDDGVVLQTQKVHLHQADFLDRFGVILRDDVAVFFFQRHQFIQGFFADNDAARMTAGVTRHAFDLRRAVAQTAHRGIGRV